jgi:glycosyltransferase involved in cell wall biosynthesis
MPELISVIVPVYNAEKTLDTCLQSIISQTYSNLEIILVNDGSFDSSLNICTWYADKDSRIKVITSINQGVSKARNLGMETASGKYFGFIDSDDWVEPQFFESLYKGITTIPNTCLSIIGVSTGKWKQYLQNLCNNERICILSYEKALDEITKSEGLRGYLCNKLFLRTNLRLNTSVSVCEDLEFTVRYLGYFQGINFTNIVVCNECAYHYIREPLINTHQYNKYGFTRYLTAFKAYESMMNNISKEYIYLHKRITLDILKLAYRLLIDWYSIPSKERNYINYEQQSIKAIQEYFDEYYFYARNEKAILWRIKFLLMKRFSPIVPKLLILKFKLFGQ